MAPGRRRPRLRCWGTAEGLGAGPGSEAATWADPGPQRASTAAGGLRGEPAGVSSRAGAPRGLQPPGGPGTRRPAGGSSSRSFCWLTASSSARRLSSSAAFSGKGPPTSESWSRAPQSQSHPQKTFPEVGFAAAAGAPRQLEVQTLSRAGWGGGGGAGARGPGRRAGGRRARLLCSEAGARGAPGRTQQQTGGRGRVCRSVRWPLWASSRGLQAAAAPAFSLQ